VCTRGSDRAASCGPSTSPLDAPMTDSVPPGEPSEELPYELHTNRELEFMLTRGKPLAHFSEYYPPEPDEEVIPKQAFSPHVADGTFVMREFVELGSRPSSASAPPVRGALHVFYAQPQHEWRIDAFIMMMAAAARDGWSEGFERLQGSLLGYEEWQTDVHLERMRKSADAQRLFYWLRKPDGSKR
jgi:hypothetical protein